MGACGNQITAVITEKHATYKGESNIILPAS